MSHYAHIPDRRESGSASRPERGQMILYGLIVICCAIEVILTLADRSHIGSARLSQLAYDYGWFWPELMNDWRRNYAAEPFAMFFTYRFLHAGGPHLAVNMITPWSLDQALDAEANDQHR